MPRNRNGTPEIRELFAAVDKLSGPTVIRLVSPDGAHLSERGQRVQRNYVNWRMRKLVPEVLKNSPPRVGDAKYMARFLQLTDGDWLPNSVTVQHIFVQGVPCPPQVLSEAIRSLGIPLVMVEADDPEGVAPEDLIATMFELLQDQGRGNKKEWRETSRGKPARFFLTALDGATATPSDNDAMVADEARDEPARVDLGPAIAQIIAALFTGILGQDIDPQSLHNDADLAGSSLAAASLEAAGISLNDFSTVEFTENQEFLTEQAEVFGRALNRLRTNPESITTNITRLRPLLIIGAQIFPAFADRLGVKAGSDDPHDLAVLDTILIIVAAYLTERQAQG